jgi:amidase
MVSEDLARLDATAQAELVRNGEATPSDLVEAAIARIEKVNPQLNAVIHPRFEEARQEAASADLPDGPFRGVPFLLKDLGGNLAGAPYHAGMALLKRHDFRSERDSFLTERLRRAGFVILGRTNTPELGLSPTTEPAAHGPTRSPWDPAHSPGGSSGGASAAVASGMVPAAHASDGGGSIRIPASHAGLVGLKPSRGRISFGPDLGDRWNGFSAELVVTRSIRDTAGILDVVHGPAPGDPYFALPPQRPYRESAAADPGRLRIGLLDHGPRGIEIDPECTAAAQVSADALRSLGHEVVESHPDALEDPEIAVAVATVISCNTARALDAWGEKLGVTVTADDVEPMTWALAEIGRSMSSSQFLRGIELVHRLSRRMAAWWESGFDVLLTPTCGEPPPLLGRLDPQEGNPLAGFAGAAIFAVFTSPFNATGQPAMSVPVHWTPDGLPVGAQLVGAANREDVLLSVGAQLEQALPWTNRRPPIHA